MRRSKVVSMMIIVAMLALVGLSTAAYFSDTETSSGNRFTAGTLDLQVMDENGEYVNGPLDLYWPSFISNMKPGDSATWCIGYKNVGTIPGSFRMDFANLTESAGADVEPELSEQAAGVADLADAVMMELTFAWWGNGDEPDASLGHWVGSLAEFQGWAPTDRVLAGEHDGVIVKIWIPEGEGNRIMGDTVDFDVVFSLDQ